MCCSCRQEGWIINDEIGRYRWCPWEHGVYVLHSWINESSTEKRVRWPDEHFSRAGVRGFSDSEGHVEPAVSIRPCLLTPEIQTEIHHESKNSLNVCPVVEDEEQSEESRAVRVGQKKLMTPTLAEREEHEQTHIPYQSWCRHCVAARASNPALRGRKFTRAVEDDKDMEQVCYHCCFGARPVGNGISNDPCVERLSCSNGVSSCGAVEWSSSWLGDSAMCS